jgi:hypothetical protein
MQANRMTGPEVTINVPAGVYLLTRPPSGSVGDFNGDLNVTAAVSGNPVISLVGAGAAATIIDANQIDRVMMIDLGRTVNVTGVTLRNGYTGYGGGIFSDGTLTVSHSTISGNRAGGSGGGIFSRGPLTVSHSTISGNQAGGSGGGIDSNSPLTVSHSTISGNRAFLLGGGIHSNGPLTVSHSTISGNRAGTSGGGIVNYQSLLTLTNSTISLNAADRDGGGVYAWGSVYVYNSSIVFNEADADADPDGGTGAGVYIVTGAAVNLLNTLVAGNNVSGAPVYVDCTGILSAYGRNLFGNPASCTIVNGLGSEYATLNSLSLLGPLQDNGGPTQTHALLPGSNAIDGGDPAAGCVGWDTLPLTTDQRGADRVVGAR